MPHRAPVGFTVERPTESTEDAAPKYSFDYQVEVPIESAAASQPPLLQGLHGHVDRVLLHREGMRSSHIF